MTNDYVIDDYQPNPRPETIEELDLTVRTYNCLKREGIHTVSDVAARTEDSYLDIRNFGQRSVDEIKAKLADLGMSLKPPSGRLRVYYEDVVHEQINVYHCGPLTLRVLPDGRVEIEGLRILAGTADTVELYPKDFEHLYKITDQVRSDAGYSDYASQTDNKEG